MDKVATFQLSLDFECGWGAVRDGLWRPRQQAGVYQKLRPVMNQFIKLLDDLEIQCTFATVAAMVDPHADDKLDHLKGDFRDRAYTFAKEADATTRNGRDLFEMVQSAKVRHEIQSHSYSHVCFTDPEQDAESVYSDLLESRRHMKTLGYDVTKFVFPQNYVDHIDKVRSAGFEAARMPPKSLQVQNKLIRKIKFPIQRVLQTPPLAYDEVHSSGLRLAYGSHFLNWGKNASSFKQSVYQRNAFRVLQKAANKGGQVHMWLHPFNLAETDGLMEHVREVMVRVASYRESGTMKVTLF